MCATVLLKIKATQTVAYFNLLCISICMQSAAVKMLFSIGFIGQKVHMSMDMAMQMKVETSVENRLWANKMTKHVMEINKHLQSQLLDLMQQRLFRPTGTNIEKTTKKKLKVHSPQQQEKQQP